MTKIKFLQGSHLWKKNVANTFDVHNFKFKLVFNNRIQATKTALYASKKYR